VPGREDQNASHLWPKLDRAFCRVLLHAGRKITNVRKRRNRESEANSKESKRNYRQSNEDQIQPGSHQEESSHNSKKSGQSQYHPQESKTDFGFVEEVVLLGEPVANKMAQESHEQSWPNKHH
jgi:hypothetical protein